MLVLLLEGSEGGLRGERVTEERQVMSMAHSLNFCQMWDNASAISPMKPPGYLVPVITVNPKWSKRALACLTIAGLMIRMDLIGLGKYSLAGLVDINKLNTFLIFSKLPPVTASSAYQGYNTVETAAFICSGSGSISMP